ncbi:uncharacterized protein LOC122252961 [Penaeus japonicus]|uniref:uncharacterized protein LOC122252961 n=1 Tax=Penaeus japonicus TaxID=27405 RepID=UPI001C70D103|nr:uncharacterized protein LOC122252961 [Penaeus japonicus]
MDGKTKGTVEATAKPASPAPGVPHAPAATGRDLMQYTGCISLRGGTITIGVLYLLISLLLEVLLIYIVCQFDMHNLTVPMKVALVIVSISTITASLLLFGAVKNRHGLIVPWIIWEGINVGLGILGILYSTLSIGPAAIIGLLIATIRLYFLYVVIEFCIKLLARTVHSQAMC